jgi:hypothetical protein
VEETFMKTPVQPITFPARPVNGGNLKFYEAFVAKRNDSLYPVQLNSPEQTTPTWMKHRFIKYAMLDASIWPGAMRS